MMASRAASSSGVFPMTFEQESMWLDDHLDSRPSRYLESWVYRLRGKLDVGAVRWAIARIVDRHEVLRSRMILEEDRLLQVVQPPPGDVGLCELSCPAGQFEAELTRLVRQPIDLESSPMRPILLRLASDDSVLVIQFHHIVVDDWALAVFDREFAEYYLARVDSRPARLKPLPLQIGEYAQLQRSAGIDPGDLRYWRDRLRDAPVVNAVPHDRPRPAEPSYQGGRVEFGIDADLASMVRQESRSWRTTPFTVFAAALAVLVCAYTGAPEVIVSTPVSRRGTASLDQMIGCLTDLMPLRIAVAPGDRFADVVARAKLSVLEAIAHRAVPYPVIVRLAGSGRMPAQLGQSVIVVGDAPRDPFRLPGISAERIYVPSGMSKFDICTTLVNTGQQYSGFLDYASELYDRASAERVGRDYQMTLLTGLTDQEVPILAAIAGCVRATRDG
ncbi:MAG TPA: condensation domain-containing protein [Streptosporangiaceae bacterium]|nr:condensation domain-containing protein [Streptosporangiaceae bacterium]